MFTQNPGILNIQNDADILSSLRSYALSVKTQTPYLGPVRPTSASTSTSSTNQQNDTTVDINPSDLYSGENLDDNSSTTSEVSQSLLSQTRPLQNSFNITNTGSNTCEQHDSYTSSVHSHMTGASSIKSAGENEMSGNGGK